MTSTTRPTLLRRRLRTELRTLREEAGNTRDDVASAMDWSLSKLIRIESGTVSITVNDLKALLDFYQVPRGERWDDLLDLAKVSRQRMWWSDLRDKVSPQLLTFIGFEAEASRISYYCTVFLPGTFQTEAYTRAIISGVEVDPRPAEAVESWVQTRLSRQQAMARRKDEPHIHAVLDEAALHRTVGGPKIMADQLGHLVELASSDRVTLQVLPFAAGENPGMARTFVMFSFGDPNDDVVFTNGGPEDVFIQDSPDLVQHHHRIFARLCEIALDEDRSVQLIQKIARTMTE
jgi:transcriptional regulator with XRE-family HTH domain